MNQHRAAPIVGIIVLMLIGVSLIALGVHMTRAGLNPQGSSKPFVVIIGGAALIVIGVIDLYWRWRRSDG